MVTAQLTDLGSEPVEIGMGATIMLSVPTLVMQDAGVVLLSLITQRGAWIRIETDLYRPDASLSVQLVFAPDWTKPNVL